MSLINFPITGGAQQHSSTVANLQKRVNVFSSPAGDMGRGDPSNNNLVLMPTAGLDSIYQFSPYEINEIIVVNDTYCFVISNLTVYSVSFDPVTLACSVSSIGTLTGDASTIDWDYNRTQIMLVNGSANWGYIINYINNTVTQITNSNFLGGTSVVQVDGYFIVNIPDTQIMHASSLNDGLTWNSLDVASAESRADNLKALAVDKGELLAIGTRTIEFWYNAGNPSAFPFARRDSEYYNIGISATRSRLNIDNTLFLLDHRRYLVALTTDNGLQILSQDPWIRNEFAKYSRVDDAFAYEFQDLGHLMYCIVFPSIGKTWCYDLTTQQWHERAYWNAGDTQFTRHRVNACQKFANKFLAGDYENGKLYVYDSAYRDDDGDPQRRLFTTAFFHNYYLNTTVNSLYIYGDFGRATASGTGSDPQIVLRTSGDGGHTYGNEMYQSLGVTGDYRHRPKWDVLGCERQWQFEFSIYEPIDFSITELGLDIEVSNV